MEESSPENSIGFHLDFLDRIGESLEETPLDDEGQKAAKHLEVRHRLRELKRNQDQKATISTVASKKTAMMISKQKGKYQKSMKGTKRKYISLRKSHIYNKVPIFQKDQIDNAFYNSA